MPERLNGDTLADGEREQSYHATQLVGKYYRMLMACSQTFTKPCEVHVVQIDFLYFITHNLISSWQNVIATLKLPLLGCERGHPHVPRRYKDPDQ